MMPRAKGKTPEESLRILIFGIMGRMFGEDRPAWTFRIMAHEMAQPSPALSQVIDEVMRPRYNLLRGIVGQMLGCRRIMRQRGFTPTALLAN